VGYAKIAILCPYHHRLLRHWQHIIKYTQYKYIKYIEIETKENYNVTVPTKTRHTASLTHT